MKRLPAGSHSPMRARLISILQIGPIVLAVVAVIANVLWLFPAAFAAYGVISHGAAREAWVILAHVALAWVGGLCTMNFFWLNGHSDRERVKLLRAGAIISHAAFLLIAARPLAAHGFGHLSAAEAVVLAVPVISLTALLLGPRIPFRKHECSECGYDMTGNASGKCPECGTPWERR